MTATVTNEPVFFRHVPHQPGTAALELDGVVVRYQTRVALDHLTLRINAGERVAVVGPNGAGKSTLFKAAAGLLSPDQGDIRVFGAPPRQHACIAYVVQRSEVDWSFPVSVADVVMMGRVREMGFFHRPSARIAPWCGAAWSGWACRTWPRARSANFRAASSSACLSPAPWPSRRN
jgi:ABC-type molybdenum transport system ATPase subunit/photorepair protein PhrA